MIYNIIGDIHGQTKWKDLIIPDAVNIFVGDYFSPYSSIPFSKLKQNFFDIINYKKSHPETILLLGNHDAEYWKFNESYSRHDRDNEKEICHLFEDNKEYFQAAYSIENKVLVTHAGVSYVWYERYKNHNLAHSALYLNKDNPKQIEYPYTGELCDVYPVPPTYSIAKSPEEAYQMYMDTYHSMMDDDDKIPDDGTFIEWHDKLWRYSDNKFEEFIVTPDEVSDFINKIWQDKPSVFSFNANASHHDYYGTTDRHGPMWIRPNTLSLVNIFLYSNYIQVFGHTINESLAGVDQIKGFDQDCLIPLTNENINDFDLYMVDCLSYDTASLLYNSKTSKFLINKHK